MNGQTPEEAAPPPLPGKRCWPLPLLAGLAALVLAGGALLFLFDPARHAFYPVCLFKKMTGYDCPGCGGLRAMHQLLRGDMVTAFHLNALAVIALPLLGVWALRVCWQTWRGRAESGAPAVFWAWAAIAVIIVFGVVRNLPFWPFGVTPM